MQLIGKKWLAASLSALAVSAVATAPSFAKEAVITGKGPTAEKIDIVNELKRRGSFHQLLNALSIAYNMDNQLKGKGPFTLFAPDDKAFAKMPEEDRTSLFNNPKRIAEVLSYHVVKDEKLDSSALEAKKSIPTMDPKHNITISSKDSDKKKGDKDLYADKARIKEANIECSNGIIHIIDGPIMPPLAE